MVPLDGKPVEVNLTLKFAAVKSPTDQVLPQVFPAPPNVKVVSAPPNVVVGSPPVYVPPAFHERSTSASREPLENPSMTTSMPLIIAPAGMAGMLNVQTNALPPPPVVAYTLFEDRALAGFVQPTQEVGLCKPVFAADAWLVGKAANITVTNSNAVKKWLKFRFKP